MRNICFVVLTIVVFAAGEMMAQQELSNPLVPARGKPRIYVGPVGGYNRSLAFIWFSVCGSGRFMSGFHYRNC